MAAILELTQIACPGPKYLGKDHDNVQLGGILLLYPGGDHIYLSLNNSH